MFLSQHYIVPGTEQQPIIEPCDSVPVAGRLWGRMIEKVVLKFDSLNSFLGEGKGQKFHFLSSIVEHLNIIGS